MEVSVANEELVMEHRGGFGVAAAYHVDTFQIEATSNLVLEGDVEFDASVRKKIGGIEWSAEAGLTDQIMFFLFRPFQRAYLSIIISGAQRFWQFVPFPLGTFNPYRLRLEILGDQQVRAYVDGQLLFDLSEDLSPLANIDLNPAFVGNSYGTSLYFDNLLVRDLPNFVCVGFDPRMQAGQVEIRKNRTLPLGMRLLDDMGHPLTDANIPASPLIQIEYTPATGCIPIDVTGGVVPVGHGTEANEFEFAGDRWRFNLKTNKFSDAGTYFITVAPGNNYSIDPTCNVWFVKE